ncbi:MAG: acyl-CoA synthetase (AMP-forming)/AMP-acid ligase II/3-oxoacyl-(acyl-carrier-protein) synthase [Phenylobacterium sp.]|jgi:acyl-CoA synthetase (AMP-forming)/AMP-acid ligase II/3-oxoacyl-(acyl-carrier-protein) synthase/acyl carrier protein/NAD(P)-dependent dehydrogenase (short-subunit alcohol dehydrogenase family)
MAKINQLVDLVQHQAQKKQHQPAFTFLKDGEQAAGCLTFALLEQRAKTIAAHLQTLCKPGDRALLLYPSGLDYICAFFGCMFAGVIAVPSYPPRKNRSDSRLASIYLDAEPSVIMASAEIHQFAHQQDFLSQCETWLVTDKLDDTASPQSAQWQMPAIDGETLAFLQYTSGSTGDPKGVMVSHANLLHNAQMIMTHFEHDESTVFVSWTPLFHDMGLIGNVIQPLFIGIHCVLMAPVAFLQQPYRWLKAISDYRATTSGGPNFAYELCLQKVSDEQLATLDLSQWQVAFNGAEPVRRETLDNFSQRFGSCGFKRQAILTCYGMAETTLLVTCDNRHQPTPVFLANAEALQQGVAQVEVAGKGFAIVSCGKPWSNNEVALRIINPSDFSECDDLTIGEVWAKGADVTQGYWHNPQATKDTYQAFTRSGDLGFFADGELYFTGRHKDLIIIRGQNHYPQDIELTTGNAHEALNTGYGAAFSIERDRQEHLVVVYEVHRTAMKSVSIDEVVKAVRKAISLRHDLMLDALVLIKPGSLAKTSSGKIQRSGCRRAFLKGKGVEGGLKSIAQWQLPVQALVTSIEGHRSSENIEQWLAAKVAATVGIAVDSVDINASFSEYGLDSAHAVAISADLAQWLQRDIAPGILYDYSSIKHLAAFLTGNNTEVMTSTSSAFQQPIAIVGLGCRFAGTEGLQSFWQLLCNNQDAISELPQQRKLLIPDSARCLLWGGYVLDVDCFDADFFNITPREAKQMDPQQRLLLEVSWQALHHAGIEPVSLAASNGGVFIGITSNDYMRLPGNIQTANTKSRQGNSAYVGTGNAMSIAANRLSYQLDLRGPSKAIDTACSSSLVAVHDACRSLLANECELAIAGGVNLRLASDLTNTFADAKMLAPDGRCKTFDASANGYVRSEGCGIVVLKRLSDAKRDKDTIAAVIAGSAVNQDGRSNGITAPNGPAQQAVVKQALANAGLQAQQLHYIESHGTGTPLGDPIEVAALQAVVDASNSPHRCYLGAVKSNIGHLEAAAGIAGLIKTVLAMRHELLPANLHHQQLNPSIDLSASRLTLVNANIRWPTDGQSGQKYAGISAFGFGGTNSHMIVASHQAGSSEGLRQSHPQPSWQRQSYWFDQDTSGPHPLLGSAQNNAFMGEADHLFDTRLSEYSPGYLTDHVIYQQSLLPATGFLEMALAACDSSSLKLQQLHIVRPMALSDKPLRVQCMIKHGQQLSIVSEVLGSWMTHAQGELLPEHNSTLPQMSLQQLQKHCEKVLNVEFHYQKLAQQGMVYGPQFQLIEQLFIATDISNSKVLSRLKALESGQYQLHPVLMDAALQSLAALIDWQQIARAHAVVPTLFGQMTVVQAGAKITWAAGELVTADYGTGSFTACLWCYDQQGEMVAHIGDIELQALSAGELTGKENRALLYQLDWQISASIEPEMAKRPLVFADDLQSIGLAGAIVITRGPTPQRLTDNHFEIRPQQAGDLLWLMEQLDMSSVDQLIYAWTADSIDSAVGNGQMIRLLVQLLLSADVSLSLCLLTTNACHVGSMSPERAPLLHPVGNCFDAPLLGMAKVIALEYPQFHCRVVDLAQTLASQPLSGDEAFLSLKVIEPLLAQSSEDLAQLYHPRLVAAPSHTRQPISPVAVDADKCYLITGGTGALGQVMLQWLIEQGATKVVLVSRSASSLEAGLAPMDGVEIFCQQADVSDYQQLARVLATLPAPLAGVIHAAGHLEDGLLAKQTRAQFERVLASKVAGSWHLHQLTADLPLDFMLLFSSVSSVLGVVAQANYAAANSFMDALASLRQSQGLVAQSINWGPWLEQGMATSEAAKQAYGQLGIVGLTNAQALSALDTIINQPQDQQTVVLAAEWQALIRHRSEPLLAQITSLAENPQDQVFIQDYQALGTKQQQQNYIYEQLLVVIRKVLELPSEETLKLDRGFFELGVDSLMAVEIKNQLQSWLGKSLSSTLLFKYPDMDALVAFVAEQLSEVDRVAQSEVKTTEPISEAPVDAPVDKGEQQQEMEDVSEMSEQQLEALIDAKLDQFL